MILPPAFDLSLRVMGDVAAGGMDDVQGRLGTFLFWAVALDERMEKLNGIGYTEGRDIDDSGRLLTPARFARNALAHGSTVAVDPGGLRISFTIPFSIPPASWRPLSELVEEWPDRWRPGSEREVAYGDLLSTKPIGDFMPRVRAWFELQRHSQ